MFYCFLQVKTTNNAGSKIIFKFNCTFIIRDAFTSRHQIVYNYLILLDIIVLLK